MKQDVLLRLLSNWIWRMHISTYHVLSAQMMECWYTIVSTRSSSLIPSLERIVHVDIYACIYLCQTKYLSKFMAWKRKSQFPQALKLFTKEVGVPNDFILDPSGEKTSDVVHTLCQKIGTTLRILEERTQHADRAELYIGLLKEYGRKYLRETHAQMKLWCYCADHRASISNLIAKNMFQL